VESGGVVAQGLLSSLRAAGDPFVPVRIETYRRREFEVAGRIVVQPEYDPHHVVETVRQALQSQFAFAARAFGQPVALSEIIDVVHSVGGVVAVDIDRLRRADLAHKGAVLGSLSLPVFPGAGKASSARFLAHMKPARRVGPPSLLLAELPGAAADGTVRAAELLLLAPRSLERIEVS
jgi:hypothetical protein